MHKLLKKTHFEGNINILKVRDYYFNKARILNNRYRKWCLMAPIALTVVGMLFCFVVRAALQNIAPMALMADVVEDWLDIAVGVVAVLSFVIDCFLSVAVDKHLKVSNHFRELYDCEVFEIPKNRFFATDVSDNLDEYMAKADEVSDSNKYEVWYRELFSENNFYNKICLIMDNVIYTYHVYKANSKRILRVLYIYIIVFVAYTIWFFMASGSLTVMVNPLILFIAVFDDIKDLIASYSTAEELYLDNKGLKEYIVGHAQEIKNTPVQEQEGFLRSLQDVVYFNRTKAMFIPKSIRDKFLDNKCIFYWELDEVKSIFMGEQVTKPEAEADFDIPVPMSHSEGKEAFVSMKEVHDLLRTMLEEVKEVLDNAGIEFLLDGGTLIGCMRKSNNNRFLAWDDDVDISIRTEDVQKAKDIIREKLGEKYVIQDYDNETYYSPRLSTFRIRQKNEDSFIDEKDSPLYELYGQRGLFLDVYAYCPVLHSKNFDFWYRKFFIYPLHKHIKKVELQWKTADAGHREAKLKKFSRLKEKYMDRSKWYKEHAKCTDFYTYEPHYIENMNTPGPYIPKEDLYYPETKQALFEGKMYGVPANSENVLRAFYGKNWETSPLVPVEVLKQPETSMYHPILTCRFVDSAFKHIFVLPKMKKRSKLSGLQRERNEYTKYTGKIEKLSKQIKKLDGWYAAHAKNRKKYALRPGAINVNSVNLYYSPEMIGYADAAVEKSDFDRHMYSKSSFEASVYKHVKGVWIKKIS